MPVIAETHAERLSYIKYVDPLIDSRTQPDPLTDPGKTGGQVLRYLSHDLQLTMDQYRAEEMRQDRQRIMGSNGSRYASGSVKGFLSAGTQQDWLAAVMRGTWAAATPVDQTTLTSIAFNKTASTIVFGGGDPVAGGLRAGMVISTAGITGANLNQRYTILSFSGASNRTVNVAPAPVEDLAAATTFTTTPAGKTLINPSSNLVDHKLAIEIYNPEAQLVRLYTECRVGGLDLDIPVNDSPKLDFTVLGRNYHVYTDTDTPFLDAPADQTSTDIPSAMNGILLFNGMPFGVATSVKVSVKLNPEPAKVINPEGMVAAVFLKDFMCDGSFSSYVDGSQLFELFDEQTEFGLMLTLPAHPSSPTSSSNTFFLPRIRILTLQEADSAGGKLANCTFEAARYFGSDPGVPSTTLAITDSEVA